MIKIVPLNNGSRWSKVANENLENKIVNATKWSSLTEIAVKLVSPVTNMILARVLAPEAFGVVATITMIVSFAEMFTDAGFQKYMVQSEFETEIEKNRFANVSFWTNLLISIGLWTLIFFFRENIASAIGNPGLGDVIALASVQLVITSFSSIQMALYRRNFNFKTLFFVRIVAVFIPLFVTLPLAFLGLGYWAIIVGNITTQLSNAIILTVKSEWKPRLYFNTKILRKMFSFSFWSLIEAISIWLTTWADTFIIGSLLTQYYLGIYKTSTSMVNALLSLITGATTPILFSSLSRLQKDEQEYNQLFLKFQRMVSIIVLPLGIGVYLYRELASSILLGSSWTEASDVIGIWAITGSIMIVFSNYFSELYRSKGKPKLSVLAQVLHLIVLVPACLISASYGFWALIYTRAFVRFQLIGVHFFILKFTLKFPIRKMFSSLAPILISSFLMGIFGIALRSVGNGITWNIVSILFCIIFYFSVILIFPTLRKELINLSKKIINNN